MKWIDVITNPPATVLLNSTVAISKAYLVYTKEGYTDYATQLKYLEGTSVWVNHTEEELEVTHYLEVGSPTFESDAIHRAVEKAARIIEEYIMPVTRTQYHEAYNKSVRRQAQRIRDIKNEY